MYFLFTNRRVHFMKNRVNCIETTLLCITALCTLSAFNILINLDSSVTPQEKREFEATFEQAIQGPVQYNIKQDDPRLLEFIRKNHLVPPSKLEYNFTNEKVDDPSQGRTPIINKLLNNKRNGFFLELGANDGEFQTNTLYYEKSRGWSGLLIEAGPHLFQKLKNKHRKAWLADCCVSLTPYPSKVVFREGQFDTANANSGLGQITDHKEEGIRREKWTQCFPLYSILLAINVTTIDFLSLDIEGGEYEVLTTIPWDKVDIKVMTVEYAHDKVGRDFMQRYLESKGYKYIQDLRRDMILIKKELANE